MLSMGIRMVVTPGWSLNLVLEPPLTVQCKRVAMFGVLDSILDIRVYLSQQGLWAWLRPHLP